MKKQNKILCIADSPEWIFNRHIAYLSRYLKDDFELSVAYRGDEYQEDAYDLIYPLEFDMVSSNQIKQPGKYVTGIRSFVAWADWDIDKFIQYLHTHFCAVHVVSKQLLDIFSPFLPYIDYVSHGVDTDFFAPMPKQSSPKGKLRLGWAGNRLTYIKGFQEFIEPLANIPGVDLVFCGFADRNLTLEEMPGFYQSIDAYICASSYEGNNNSLLEASAMELAIITTPVGTVPEYLTNFESALIVQRDLKQFAKAVVDLRDNPTFRLNLGKTARQSLLKHGWDWEKKAQDFRQFFRNALSAETNYQPIEYNQNIETNQQLIKLLKIQNELLRDIRIGEIARIENEFRESNTFRIAEKFKTNNVVKLLLKLYNRIK